MKELYPISGISKQAYYKYLNKPIISTCIDQVVVDHIQKVRKNHRRMSCRRIYKKVADQIPLGRDKFEQIGFNKGFKVRRKRSAYKTTDGQTWIKYPNLLEGRELSGINQAYQSDIFYYAVEGKVLYGFTIKDVYSRRLLALHFAHTLRAEELVKAFKQVLKERKNQSLQGCIFHSDRGSQYVSSDQQEQVIKKHKLKASMCKYPQENAYVERIQGILKQEYLDDADLKLKSLNQSTRRIKYLYNYERPHSSLNMMSPVDFEAAVENLSIKERPKLTIYKWEEGFPQKSSLLTKEKRSKKEKITTINIV